MLFSQLFHNKKCSDALNAILDETYTDINYSGMLTNVHVQLVKLMLRLLPLDGFRSTRRLC